MSRGTKMASKVLENSTESYRKGTNILVVKGTAHTGLKETGAKVTMITVAQSSDGRVRLGCLWFQIQLRHEGSRLSALTFCPVKESDSFIPTRGMTIHVLTSIGPATACAA